METAYQTPVQRKRRARKLCLLHDGRWLTYRGDRYYSGDERMPTETALILLMEECKKQPNLQARLHRTLPTDDYRIVGGTGLGYTFEHLIPGHVDYLIGMLTASEPPASDYPQKFERIHRAARSEDLSDASLFDQIPLLLGHIWHPAFGDAIRNHLPATSPLTRWRVLTQLTGCNVKTPDEERSLQDETVWAFSEPRIQQDAAFWYREVLSVQQLPVSRTGDILRSRA